jgi:hypothetical protein
MAREDVMFKKWIMNVLIGIDQLGNAIWMGDPDETISSRLGKLKVKNGGKIPWWPNPLAKIIDFGLDKIDKNHSVDAIEKDEGKEQVVEDL